MVVYAIRKNQLASPEMCGSWYIYISMVLLWLSLERSPLVGVAEVSVSYT
jgi:hypothetical protein